MELINKKIFSLLKNMNIGDYITLYCFIEEIEMIDNEIKKFIYEKSNNWKIPTNISIKNTDTIDDLIDQLSYSDIGDSGISCGKKYNNTKTLFSMIKVPNNIKKITCKVKLEKAF